MKIIDVKIFCGKNIYSHKKCIRMDLDLEGYAETSSAQIPEFTTKLIEMLPELRKHRCGIDVEEGFLIRLKEGTYLAHISEHIILALQNIVGSDVAYGKAREIQDERYYIVFEYESSELAVKAAKLAVDIINSLIYGGFINIDARIKELETTYIRSMLGPTTKRICEIANEKGIPYTRISNRSLVCLGYGVNTKYIEASITNETSTVGVDISMDKMLTKNILSMHEIPVPKGFLIHSTLELLLKAKEISYPIVLKPQYGNQGRGVFVNIKNSKEALRIFNKLKKEYESIILEEYITGDDFRVLLVDYKVVAVSKKYKPMVIGNGKNTILELIKIINKDPLRGREHEKPMSTIKIDEELITSISKNGYSLNMILERGKILELRESANISTGGFSEDKTDIISKENIEICERAARAINLNICGLDICAKDISKSIYEYDGYIIEVNACPGTRMHEYPKIGRKRNVSEKIIDMIYKNGYKDIPIISVTGTNGKTTVTRLISYIMEKAKYNIGMAVTGGIYIKGKKIVAGDTTGPISARSVLLNPEIDAAVLETARGGLIREGLFYNEADVGIITNITNDHIGIDGINTLEELAHAKSLVIECVKKNGTVVFNADDEYSMKIKNRATCSEEILFSRDKNNIFIKESIEKGNTVVYEESGKIKIVSNGNSEILIDTKNIALTAKGLLEFNIENAMAAICGLLAVKVDKKVIVEGLEEFNSDYKNNPGRFNIFNIQERNVILDYGHNVEGFKVVSKSIEKFKGTKIGIIGMPGDRKDEDIKEIAQISMSIFDKIYIKEDINKRGRKPGEVSKIIDNELRKNGYKKKDIKIISDEERALEKAFDESSKGDTIIIFCDDYEKIANFVRNKTSEELREEIMA